MTLIRSAHPADAAAIAAIYNHYVASSTITFEEAEVGADVMAVRIAKVISSKLPWLVIEQDGKVLGYAYASKWKERSAYRFSVESSIYLQQEARGRGLARKLYQHLFELLRQSGVHLVIGGVALPNDASVGLHRKMGFQPVGAFKEVGRKFGRWIDVSYWQLRLE
ncbi:arsinothricin resistance N-acetyltransferase ArsN1 family B [Pseudoduganella violaceinigra]|uniref:arsinothricin resistance N-acetyltransferase ArsN1 family B n=1 Tax=Pseudoduganella violaceinigra TaxID=246602 RepID=UPI00041DE137|nr:arsinothricin resistance N-acetyltransferase ArsN1 family B [Pseudoduganella violaceinigra]